MSDGVGPGNREKKESCFRTPTETVEEWYEKILLINRWGLLFEKSRSRYNKKRDTEDAGYVMYHP